MGDILVQQFDVDVDPAGSTLALATAVDTGTAFLRNNTSRRQSAGPIGNTGNTYAPEVSLGMALTAADEVTFYRGAGTLDVKVCGEVWSYVGLPGGGNEFVVRSHEVVTIPSGQVSATVSLSGVVNKDKVVPFLVGSTIPAGSTDSFTKSAASVYIDALGQLVVARGVLANGADVTVYVEVVEFTGANWSVGHAMIDNPQSSSAALNMYEGSDATGNAFDVGDWTTAFIEGSMNVGGGNYAIEDTFFTVSDGPVTTQVAYARDGSAGTDVGGQLWVHIIQNDGLVIARVSDSKSTIPNNNTYEVETFPGITLTDLSMSALEWYTISDGSGTAHARGALTAKLTSLTEIQSWCHRNGNLGTYNFGVMDLSGLSDVPPSEAEYFVWIGGVEKPATLTVWHGGAEKPVDDAFLVGVT